MEASIYKYPDIFRRVHMERPGDIEAETAFMLRVWKRHLDRPPRRVLDVACGNSPHGQILAREGIEVVGIDRSPTMIAAGRRESRGLPMRFYRRSIAKFSIPERACDGAFFMSETFPVLVDNRAILDHLRSVAATMLRGGIYCIDIDKMDAPRMPRERRQWQRRTVRIGDIVVKVRTFHHPIPWHSALHSIYELECEIHFPDRIETTRDVIPIRHTLPPTLELAAQASGVFEMVAAYSDLSMVEPIAQCHGRWLGVLRKI